MKIYLNNLIALFLYVIIDFGENMGTSKEYRDYVLKQLSLLEGVTCRPMMGEFLLYNNGTLFGGIYDFRLLVKITDTNKVFGMS